ncbi:MAG: hypothetical protein ABFS32_01525 [Bacteroidota bacterium]
MKLPSIIKIPHYQRFNYEPRYYDPVKEDIEERRKKARRQLESEKRRNGQSRARLEGAFTRRAHYEDNSSFLRLIVGVILFSGVVGFLYFGNIALYLTVAAVFVYLVLKKVVFR